MAKQTTSKDKSNGRASTGGQIGKAASSSVTLISDANANAWQKRTPPPLPVAHEAEAVSRLLALLNGGEFQAAGALWRCRAQQLMATSEKHSTQEQAPPQGQPQAQPQGQLQGQLQGHGRWSLHLRLGGASCLCHAVLPAGLRKNLETMCEPYSLEELPESVASELLTLALTPLLQELFATPCRIVQHELGCLSTLSFDKLQVVLLLEALPVATEGKSIEPFRLHCRLATQDLEEIGKSLRIRRRRNIYPQNLYTSWQLEAGSTRLSLKEFRALEEGDVLLLS